MNEEITQIRDLLIPVTDIITDYIDQSFASHFDKEKLFEIKRNFNYFCSEGPCVLL